MSIRKTSTEADFGAAVPCGGRTETARESASPFFVEGELTSHGLCLAKTRVGLNAFEIRAFKDRGGKDISQMSWGCNNVTWENRNRTGNPELRNLLGIIIRQPQL